MESGSCVLWGLVLKLALEADLLDAVHADDDTTKSVQQENFLATGCAAPGLMAHGYAWRSGCAWYTGNSVFMLVLKIC